MRTLFLYILLFSLLGCGPRSRPSAVVMKINDQQAHVYLSQEGTKVGDRVTLFRNNCQRRHGCKKEKKGEGIVTEILNDHYSVIRVTDGAFDEGTLVETIKPK